MCSFAVDELLWFYIAAPEFNSLRINKDKRKEKKKIKRCVRFMISVKSNTFHTN